jgi:hypothetical protein
MAERVSRSAQLRAFAPVCALLACALLVGSAAPSRADSPAVPAKDTLHTQLAAARLPLIPDRDGFSGPGWKLIAERASAARFVAIGEDHLTREVPRFTEAICRLLGPQGLAAMAVEAGPFAAAELQGALRMPDRLARMRTLLAHYPDSVAFLNIRQENDLLAACAASAPPNGFQLWGLDQEFLGSAGWLLARLAAERLGKPAMAAVHRLQAEEAADALVAQRSGDPSQLFLFRATRSELDEAARPIRQTGTPRARQILDALIQTHDIYQASAAGAPTANTDRALLLKQTLAAHLAKTPHGKILLKFGEWHLYRGYNPLRNRDLGNYLAEMADLEGSPSLHIMVLGAKGVHAVYGGYGRPLQHLPFVLSDDPDYRWIKAATDEAETSGWTVFDLRRLRGAKLEGLPMDWQRVALGYDLLVLAPEITPADAIGDSAKP